MMYMQLILRVPMLQRERRLDLLERHAEHHTPRARRREAPPAGGLLARGPAA